MQDLLPKQLKAQLRHSALAFKFSYRQIRKDNSLKRSVSIIYYNFNYLVRPFRFRELNLVKVMLKI
jgi:hypothetical protein